MNQEIINDESYVPKISEAEWGVTMETSSTTANASEIIASLQEPTD
jgi:hypothetical protein